jgi:putative toxin of predicted polymorphic toxin system/protease prsW family protein
VITPLLVALYLLAQLYLVCRNRTVGLGEVLRVFVVGASAIPVLSFVLSALLAIFIPYDTLLGSVGPLVEEIAKVAFVAYLLFRTQFGRSCGLLDGLLLGAAVGAGFGFVEDTVRGLLLGLEQMYAGFPHYRPASFFTVLLTWLPGGAEGGVPGAGGHYSATHAEWTGLVGLGCAVARKLSPRLGPNLLIPLGCLLWVIVEHAASNTLVIGGQAGVWNPVALFGLLGNGWYLRGGQPLLIVLALVAEEGLIRRGLRGEDGLLLPGEARRSLVGEAGQIVRDLTDGWRTWREALGGLQRRDPERPAVGRVLLAIAALWHAFAATRQLTTFFRLRRQLAFARLEGGPVEELRSSVGAARAGVVAATGLATSDLESDALATFTTPPAARAAAALDLQSQLIPLLSLALALSSLFTLWYLLFSLYFPASLSERLVHSPLLPLSALLGWGTAIWALVRFYRQPRAAADRNSGDRVQRTANVLLIHCGGLTCLTGLFAVAGITPSVHSRNIFDLFRKLGEQLGIDGKMLWGLASMALDFMPVIGQIKGFTEALCGKDLLTGDEIPGWQRALLLIPFAGAAAKELGLFGKLGGWLTKAIGRGARAEEELVAAARRANRIAALGQEESQLSRAARRFEPPPRTSRIGPPRGRDIPSPMSPRDAVNHIVERNRDYIDPARLERVRQQGTINIVDEGSWAQRLREVGSDGDPRRVLGVATVGDAPPQVYLRSDKIGVAAPHELNHAFQNPYFLQPTRGSNVFDTNLNEGVTEFLTRRMPGQAARRDIYDPAVSVVERLVQKVPGGEDLLRKAYFGDGRGPIAEFAMALDKAVGGPGGGRTWIELRRLMRAGDYDGALRLLQ